MAKNEKLLTTEQQYFKEIKKFPLLKQKDEIALAKRIKRGDKKARERFINANLLLVTLIARKYRRKGIKVAFLDLVQEGNIGLIRAVEKFDYRKGYKFSTFAILCIRQTINYALSDKSRIIRIPVDVVGDVIKYKKTTERLLQDLGREPSPEEVATEVDLGKIKNSNILQAALDIEETEIISLETTVSDDENGVLGDFIKDETIYPNEEVDKELLKYYFQENKLFPCLDPREKKILDLRFGITEEIPHTLEEIGQELGVTRERIRQIEAKALEKIRKKTNVNELKKFLC